MDTNKHFYNVIKKLKQIDAVTPDFFLLTGDLSQDESEKSYQKIVDVFTYFNLPVYWIPGNHDSIETMKKVFSKSSLFHHVRQLETDVANFIFMNTKLDGNDEGYLSEMELTFLLDCLKTFGEHKKQIIIVMHHHPVKTGTPLIDQYILKNAPDFWSIVDKYSNVKLIICGHVHGDYCLSHGNAFIEAAPATCMQWKKGTSTLSLEQKIGYKQYHISPESYWAVATLWGAEK